MQTDIRGYSVATDESVAVEALDRAFDAYVGFRIDTMAELDTAIAADPSFALAHVIKGILMTGLKKPEVHPAARAELDQARAGREPTVTESCIRVSTIRYAATCSRFSITMAPTPTSWSTPDRT